jgi:ribosomal protein L37AE/L43A
MTCDRCCGHLVREHLYRHGAWWWRCYNCGERVDGAILLARAEQAADAAFLRDSQDIERKQWAA